MMFAQSLPWISPLELASAIDEPYWALLYSGARTNYSGRTSLLACGLAERIDTLDALATRLSTNQPTFENAWFGYLPYELETAPLAMMRFNHIYQFDHDTNSLTLHSATPAPSLAPRLAQAIPPVAAITSPMPRATYLAHAAHIIERIHRGDLYQANLTRKFTGRFSAAPDPFSLFRALCDASPAPYSAFLQLGDRAILSSSPELFLHIGANGRMRSRPIKGTAPRHPDPARDAASRNSLSQSPKDRAENLMIADLMRHDFSRACLPGSVAARQLFEVTTHATIHHMSSTITGQKRADCPTLDAIRHCFPPGSMTGAPKIAAMRLCAELEALPRGIYSGAIGMLGGDGSCELSVVIRTLLLHGEHFEFQVGGGIVADSTPEGELEELLQKAKGLLKALNLKLESIASL